MARGFGLGVTKVRDVVVVASLERIAALRPRAVAGLTRGILHHWLPFALMSIGAVYLALSDAPSREVLDGYNALPLAPGDLESLASSHADLMSTHRPAMSSAPPDTPRRRGRHPRLWPNCIVHSHPSPSSSREP